MGHAKPPIYLVACLLLQVLGAPAAAADTQTSSSVYRSAYFLGRGDTGIASADNEDAIFYNPAGIAQGTGIYKRTVLASPMVEVSKNTRDIVTQASNSSSSNAVDTVKESIGKPAHIGVSDFSGLILRRAAIGVVATSHADLLAFDDPNAGGLEAVHASADETLGLTFTVADKLFSDHFMVGVTAKYLQRGRGDISASAADADTLKDRLKDKNNFIATGTGMGADVGMMFRGGGRINPSFGLTVNDVGDTHVQPAKTTTLDLGLKQTINAGVAIEPGTKFSHIKLLFDYHDIASAVIKDPRQKSHIGTEISVLDTVGVTAGVNEGYPTAGLYADIYFVRLDLGMYTEEVGDRVGTRPDQRYMLRLRMGF